MTKRIVWILMALMSILIGLYPAIYFFIDRKFGLLGSKSDEVLTSILWNASFYIHIILGGLALLIGWTQFNSKIRIKKLAVHRLIGKVYVVAVLLSATGGVHFLFCNRGNHRFFGFWLLGHNMVLYNHESLCMHQKQTTAVTPKNDDLQLCCLLCCRNFKDMASPAECSFGRLYNCLSYGGLVVLDTELNCCKPNCKTDFASGKISCHEHLSLFNRLYLWFPLHSK
jgi:hypothetical protein